MINVGVISQNLAVHVRSGIRKYVDATNSAVACAADKRFAIMKLYQAVSSCDERFGQFCDLQTCFL